MEWREVHTASHARYTLVVEEDLSRVRWWSWHIRGNSMAPVARIHAEGSAATREQAQKIAEAVALILDANHTEDIPF